MEQVAFFLAATVRMATPLLLAGLGLAISERSGVMNIGAEGVMLMGAFVGYAATRLTGSYWSGMCFAMIMGIVMTAIFAVSVITFKAPQAVLGAAMNILCSGLTSVLYRRMFYFSGDTAGVVVSSFPDIDIPVLSQIPVLGTMLFKHNFIVYVALIMTFVLWIVINRTSLGLKIIAVGEHPRAADSLGINVIRLRYLCVLFSGLMLGLAGAYLSVAQSNSFGMDMTSGKGFIALAVVVLGRWSPLGVLAGSMIFGGANALQMNLQNAGIDFPHNITMMIPYIVTVLAVLSVSKKKVIAPSAKGIPYEKS